MGMSRTTHTIHHISSFASRKAWSGPPVPFASPARLWRKIPTLALALCAIGLPIFSWAQEWNGTVDLAYGWVNTSGNPEAFRTQYNLDSGFSLDQLDLDYRGAGSLETFSITAWGWGNAEPAKSFRLALEFTQGLSAFFDYRSTESFFALAESDLTPRRDRWDLNRWNGGVVWTGWKDWTLGRIFRPHFGLNELYPLEVALNERMNEVGFRVENRSLPVLLIFEQTWAEFDRSNRPSVAGDQALSNPDDPDLFVGFGSTAKDHQDIPTTSLTASWGNNRWEGVATLLSSNADLSAPGTLWETYDIGGGSIGTTSWVDDVVGASEMDSLVGTLRLGFRLAQAWTLRFGYSYRDASADSTLLGRRLLHTVNPTGQVFEIERVIDETGFYDFSTTDTRLTLDWHSGAWNAWGGLFSGQRDVAWRLTTDGSSVDVNRDSDGFHVGAAWAADSGLDASVEYENGTFERYVFRTDPEKVDRLTARVRARLGGGWNLNFHGRYEQAENPPDAASLDRDSKAHGLGLTWASHKDRRSFGLNLDQVSLDSETDLVLPNGDSGISRYDLDLLVASLFGQVVIDRLHLEGSITYTTDSGETWPVDALNAVARVGYDLNDQTRVGAFIQYWDYDEEKAAGDDFTATRYGLSLRWSFSR